MTKVITGAILIITIIIIDKEIAMNNKAFYKLSYGLYIVSSNSDGRDCGCVVNTLSQVASNPAKLSVAVNKDNCTEKAIEQSGYFAATVLTQDVDMELIKEFGFKTSKDADKFKNFTTMTDSRGIKYVVDYAAARYSCKVINKIDIGSHMLFVGEVTEAEVLDTDNTVLTYEHYQKVKKGTTPKNAPSYKADTEKTGYRCTVCGYILESDTIPDDFICPVCGQGRDKFAKIEQQ